VMETSVTMIDRMYGHLAPPLRPGISDLPPRHTVTHGE
jgi:hypothetical protein